MEKKFVIVVVFIAFVYKKNRSPDWVGKAVGAGTITCLDDIQRLNRCLDAIRCLTILDAILRPSTGFRCYMLSKFLIQCYVVYCPKIRCRLYVLFKTFREVRFDGTKTQWQVYVSLWLSIILKANSTSTITFSLLLASYTLIVYVCSSYVARKLLWTHGWA